MAGENFIGGVSNLFGRLDQNTSGNMADLNAILERKKMQEALSGVESMADLSAAVPALLRSNPMAGISLANAVSGLSNADSNRQYHQALMEKQRQDYEGKMITDVFQMLSSVESEPDESLRPQLYEKMVKTAVFKYPELVQYLGKIAPLRYDSAWSKTTLNALIPAVERYKAQNAYPRFDKVQEGEENVTYETFPGGGRREIGRGPLWSEKESKPEKRMTPEQAMKRKTDLLSSRVRLLKGSEIDALLASINPKYVPGSSVDDKTKAALDAQIESEIANLDQIISGGGALPQGQPGNHPLTGKQPGRYRVNGQVIKWDGQKVIP